MTRLFMLIAAVLTLNACEQHPAADLPEEFRDRGANEVKKKAGSDDAAAPASASPSAPR